jgi:serine protein kinase
MPTGQTSLSPTEILNHIDQEVRKEFESNRRILSFAEYLLLLGEQPERQTRGSARYTADMMDFFGREEIKGHTGEASRFRLFDLPADGLARKVVGQEAVQNQIYRALRAFNRQGINNKLILLHGPNGSAKTSTIHGLMGGMERYSQDPQGALYTMNWVFPVERFTKGGMGINQNSGQAGAVTASSREKLLTYAKLPDEEMAARIPCDLKDHPILLIPRESRRAFIAELIGTKRADELWNTLPQYIQRGDLCHRCRQIYDALLTSNNGDFRKVLMHVQVERFYFARRYRRGLVTIEPQMHVDAQYHQLTQNRSISALPTSLQSLNLFALGGDLVDANRGIVEFSDLLKRPVDTFKYLLTACETGSVNVGSSIAYLDQVMVGSTNEIQLDAFKEFPDFISFKARIELIRVPYLLSVSAEEEIYGSQLDQFTGQKHIAPHVAWTVALWAVLSRLKKPNSINYAPNVSTLIANLTPVEKARLYDSGELPAALGAEDKKLLRSSLRRIAEEYMNIPYYEGRLGASAREMKSILFDAAQNSEFPCLSPLAVLREMEEFVKRISEYEFLKQDVKDGYHDAHEFINTTRNEYLNRIDSEVRDSMGIYDSTQWEDFLRKYVQQISLVLRKEKVKNSMTGKMEDPDFALIDEFERIVGAPSAPSEEDAKESFRQGVISQIGAWSLDHPREPVVYARVFSDFWRKLEQHYFESKKLLLTRMHDALQAQVYDPTIAQDEVDEKTPPTTGGTQPAVYNDEGSRLARITVQNMKKKRGYCDHCAKEVITFLVRSRY